MRQLILLVEDDEALGAQVVQGLERAGFVVRWLKRGDEAADAVMDGVALVILDLMLPGQDGFAVMRTLRRRTEVPVLVLTARQDPVDRVRALNLGADDFVTKPFWPDELLARVHARLRRPVLCRDNALVFGCLQIDLDQRRVTVNGAECELTRAEFELLAVLAKRPGAAISRRTLVDRALDPDDLGTDRTLDVHFSRLRKKLGEAGALIETVRGIGYRLRLEGAP
jgi:two-component system response regulator MtrA